MNDDGEIRLTEELLDRLVDGELSSQEYRDTLQIIASHPEGWRRCALTFLEAQAWGREFRGARVEVPVARRIESPARTGWSWWYGSLLAVACAASFLLALAISLHIQGRFWSGPNQDDFVRYMPPAPSAEDRSPAPESHLVGKTPVDVPENDPVENDAIEWPTGRYQLVVDDGSGSAQAVDMPVFATADPRARWLLDDDATAPHDLIRALQNSGNEVERHRTWIPMRSGAGAPVYVPVDELRVTPVSRRSFQ